MESGETRRLTEVGRGNFASTPAWAPDGSRFSFALRAEGGPEGMYVADANGSNVRPLDTGGLAAGASFWSPDGEYVAFHAGSEGAYGVYVVLADGGEAVKVSE